MRKPIDLKIIILAVTICSCNTQKTKSNSHTVDLLDNVELSTKTISEQSKYLYHTLETNLTKENSDHDLNYLFPKAEANYSISKKVHECIISLQEKFPISENDIKANELYDYLKLFKENLLAIDNDFSKSNGKQIFSLINDNNSKSDFVSLLAKSNEEEFKIALSKLNNSVSILENKMLTYFNISSSNPVKLIFDNFAGLVSQNCKRLSKGDTLEVSAGVGTFSAASNASIMINGTYIKVGPDGIANYSFKVNGDKGMNIVPVYIEFTSADGRKQNSKIPIIYYIDN